MLCYRDMTFCPFSYDCALAENCSRPLTADVIRRAKEWWGGDDPPIAQFPEQPSCHEPIEKGGA